MMHYYPFNIGDYRGATAHLSNEEDLAYRRLIDMYYDTEKPISLDVSWVAKRIRVEPEIVSNVLNDMFVQTADGFTHLRCQEEILKFQAFAIQGKAGASKRWAKDKNSPPIAPPLGGNSPPLPNNNQELKTKIQELETKIQELLEETTKLKTNKSKVTTPKNVSDETWSDFVRHRKTLKAQISMTALTRIEQEAAKAGWTLEQALIECVAQGWRGFKADWVKDKPLPLQMQLKSFKQMDEERSKERYNQMIGRSSSQIIDITADNFLEIN